MRYLQTGFWQAALALILLGLWAGPAATSAPERQVLPLKLGGSEVIEIERPSLEMKILTSDDDVVHVRALKEDRIYIRGKKLGYCTITVWDEKSQDVMGIIDVTVTLDLTGLKQKLHELYPEQRIEVYASEKGVVLSGTVSGPEVVEQVIRLTENFLPRVAEERRSSRGGTGRSSAGITNLLKVGGIQQVMLEVKVAEVSRTWGRDIQAAIGLEGLGNDFTGAVGTNEVLTPVQDATVNANFPNAPEQSGTFGGAISGLIQNPGSLLLNFAGNPANVFLNIDNFLAAFRFLETEGLARTLAEPRLVTMSGQEASFLAGGEFPIPVPQDLGEITIEFKEFGVALRFTPIVLSGGRISLRVAPSVSEITSVSTIPAGIQGTDFNVPNLTTRKLETTVELYDGQTLALAGLLQDNIRENVRKVPGLGDIPILGALFRSKGFSQEKTDLLIAVTPHLVRSNPEGTLEFPGENYQPPGNYEFYLESRLEGKLSGGPKSPHPGFPPLRNGKEDTGGMEGSFGYQPVSE